MLEYPMKSGILEVQRRGNLADSDPRLPTKRHVNIVDTKVGTATVSESASEITARRYWPELAETRQNPRS